MKLCSIFMKSGQGEGRKTEGGHPRRVGGLPFDMLSNRGEVGGIALRGGRPEVWRESGQCPDHLRRGTESQEGAAQ